MSDWYFLGDLENDLFLFHVAPIIIDVIIKSLYFPQKQQFSKTAAVLYGCDDQWGGSVENDLSENINKKKTGKGFSTIRN